MSSAKCHMLDLSDLDSLKKQLIIILLMPGDAGMGRRGALHLRNYIRLIDKAIYEYQEAREDLLAEIEEEKIAAKFPQKGWTLYGFAFTDHLENCINATRRLLNIADKIKGEKDARLISKEVRRLIESLGKNVTRVRDTIEHMDEKVHNGEIKDGEPVMIALSRKRDKISVAKESLELERLGLVLKKLHDLGVHLLNLAPKKWP